MVDEPILKKDSIRSTMQRKLKSYVKITLNRAMKNRP